MTEVEVTITDAEYSFYEYEAKRAGLSMEDFLIKVLSESFEA